MQPFQRIPFQADLRILAIGPEAVYRLGDCIETARLDLKPRNFAEHYLVDEMAIAQWRGIRVKIRLDVKQEKAVYDRQYTTYRRRGLKTLAGADAEPYEDMYHLAMAHAPETSRVVLAGLTRLESRYHRHFCGAFRLLLAARRGTPPPLPKLEKSLEPLSDFTPETTGKEDTTCEPSPNSSPTIS